MTGKTIARVSAGHLPDTQRQERREDDAQWHECARVSWPEGRPAKPLPPERRMGARRSGLGKTEARHETNPNLGSVLMARSAVDGRAEGWGMRPPGPRGTLSQHLGRQRRWPPPMFFFCSKRLCSEGQVQKKNKIDQMFRGSSPTPRSSRPRHATGGSKKDEHNRKSLQEHPSAPGRSKKP